jgi:hypothetical protein
LDHVPDDLLTALAERLEAAVELAAAEPVGAEADRRYAALLQRIGGEIALLTTALQIVRTRV